MQHRCCTAITARNQELFNEKGGSDDPPFSFCLTAVRQRPQRIVAAPVPRFVPKPMIEIPRAFHLTKAMG
jgi:hypothetical protein